MAVDPFELIARNNRSLDEQSARNDQYAQSALQDVFRAEAQRQLPYATLPADLALSNARGDASLFRQMKLAQFQSGLKQQYLDAKTANMPPSDIAKIITEEARAAGVDPDYLLTSADIESSFKPGAKNDKSSAGGLFQQTDANWDQYGGGGNRFDPRSSTLAAIAFTKDNMNALDRAGVKQSPGALYFLHQQGPGAVRALKNPNVPAAAIFGADAVRNNGGNLGMSAGQFANMWISRFDKQYAARVALRRRGQQQQPAVATTDTNGQPLPTIDLSGLDGDDNEES